MVRQPAVLVTGAGASAPYGFPLGGELTGSIVKSLLDPAAGREMCAAIRRTVAKDCHPNEYDFERFGYRLKGSRMPSIDGFLQFDGNKRWEGVAKAAVAWHIAQAEALGKCRPRLEPQRDATRPVAEDDWLSYLFPRLLEGATTPDRLSSNRVSIVTFNFDRVIEWHWLDTLRNVYEGLEGDRLNAAFQTLEVVHVHGAVHRDCGPAGFEAVPLGTAPNDETILKAASQINFIHDQAFQPVERALELLDEARTICFMGFSYAPINLDRIGFPWKQPAEPRKRIYGTRRGLENAEADAVINVLQSATPLVYGPPALMDVNCTKLLRVTPALHQG